MDIEPIFSLITERIPILPYFTNTLRIVLGLAGIYYSKPMAKQASTEGNDDITLKDVISHMQGMERRLTEKIEINTHSIKENRKAIIHLDVKLERLEDKVDSSFSMLEEDLFTVMTDVIAIKRFVGMPIPTQS